MKTFIRFFGWVATSIAGAGAFIVVMARVIIAIGDGSFGYVARNPYFFDSSSPAIHSFLAVPRYFFTVYYDGTITLNMSGPLFNWNQQLRNNDYGWISFLVALIALAVLVIAASNVMHNLYFKKKVDALHVLSLLYVVYWALVTVFMVYQLVSGVPFSCEDNNCLVEKHIPS